MRHFFSLFLYSFSTVNEITKELILNRSRSYVVRSSRQLCELCDGDTRENTKIAAAAAVCGRFMGQEKAFLLCSLSSGVVQVVVVVVVVI